MRLQQFRELVADPARTKPVVLVAPTKRWRRTWEAALPPPAYLATSGETGYVFLEY